MGTTFLIILLLALCGFIAYIGDLLGRRLGKRRLSVFGLRPKHTAILLTIVTGVLIAGVTFTAALLAVPGFFRLVTQGERLAVRNLRLGRQNQELERANAARQGENRDLMALNGRLAAATRSLQERNSQLVATNGRLAAENGTLADDNARLTREKSALAAQTRDLRARTTRLLATNSGLERANAGFRATNGRLAADNRRLKAEQTGLDSQVRELRLIANSYRADEYIFRREELIATVPVPPNPPADLLREVLKNLLFQAEKAARERKGGRGGSVLVLRRPADMPAGGSGKPDEICEWVSRQARAQRGRPLVVRVLAAENCVMGRPVPVRLDWFTNERVFRKGDVIASRIVPGGAPEEASLPDLILFLQSQVRTAAVSPPHSMVPREEGLGEATYGMLLDACRTIRESTGPVLLRARARQDTLRAGPLSVDLEVSPLEQTSGQSR